LWKNNISHPEGYKYVERKWEEIGPKRTRKTADTSFFSLSQFSHTFNLCFIAQLSLLRLLSCFPLFFIVLPVHSSRLVLQTDVSADILYDKRGPLQNCFQGQLSLSLICEHLERKKVMEDVMLGKERRRRGSAEETEDALSGRLYVSLQERWNLVKAP